MKNMAHVYVDEKYVGECTIQQCPVLGEVMELTLCVRVDEVKGTLKGTVEGAMQPIEIWIKALTG